MPRKPVKLPSSARGYLVPGTPRPTQVFVKAFHRWMQGEGLTLKALQPGDVDRYLARPIKPLTRNGYRYQLRRYLDWLFAHGHLGFDAGWLRVRTKPLTPHAERFLAELAPTKQPSTVRQYRQTIRHFHKWLTASGVLIEELTREQVKAFERFLYERGLAAATRVNMLVSIRVYLRYLEECGHLRGRVDDLLRSSDLPKLPVYLPRPLSPTQDEAVKTKLIEIGSRYSLGLVLMRRTGLRIGELCALPLDCEQVAADGRRFLRVPLGKLQKERLVPLDEEAAELLGMLREFGQREGRRWLVETNRGARCRHVHFQTALAEATEGLETDSKITSHRLRHTFATELVGAGMNLPSLMKLLGHLDYRMTLRYAEVTLEAVGDEYLVALEKLENRYRVAIVRSADRQDALAPDQALEHILTWLKHKAGDSPKAKRKARTLAKRLRRIQVQVKKLAATNTG